MDADAVVQRFWIDIEQEIERTGIARQEVARRMGVSKARVSQMINQRKNVTLRTMIRIYDALGLELGIVGR